VDGRRYRTARQNAAHKTDERELLYPWHPWGRRRVCIHELIEKAGVHYARCTFSDDRSDRWREVPTWMFDRIASTSWRLVTVPRIQLSALQALALFLLRHASQCTETGAAWDSRKANRRDVHVAPAYGISVRSILQPAEWEGTGDAAMAGAAGGGAQSGDRDDVPLDPRTYRQRQRRPKGLEGAERAIRLAESVDISIR
jgi:hypothetical protein